jgi:two-component system, OmpR family, alkaline phosphatase synthesis response regulator PhoP
MRVLIVEDEEHVVELLRINLLRRGHEVFTAFNGAEALEMVQTVAPDHIILDIRLPDMDGWEVCRRMRATVQGAVARIIILSASVQKNDIVRALESGANRFMGKPFDLRELLNALAES